MSTDPQQSPILRFGMIFIGAIMIISAPFAAYSGVTGFLEAQAAKSWPQVKGVITQSGVRSESRGLDESYRPEVAYEYVVDSQRFTGDRIQAKDVGSQNKESMDEIVARYPKGAERPVFYDPEDPSKSILEPGVSGTAWFLLALPVLLAGLGAIFIYAAWVSRRQAKQQTQQEAASA